MDGRFMFFEYFHPSSMKFQVIICGPLIYHSFIVRFEYFAYYFARCAIPPPPPPPGFSNEQSSIYVSL